MAGKHKIPISEFIPAKQDVILFDTNILIKLLYGYMGANCPPHYAQLYAKILHAKAKLIISSVQISEFINRCIRFQFQLYQKASGNMSLEFKKDYRSTEDYRSAMKAILEIITTDIIPNFVFIDDGFSAMQHEKIFQYGFSYDFNDSLLLEIASANNAILVTDDKDFGNYSSNVTIVTGNKTLLMFA